MTFTTIALTAVGTLAVLALGTQLLPRHIEVTRATTVQATPAQIIALASSTEGFQQINPYLTADPNLAITPFGPASGVGAGFAFDGRDGKGTQTVAQITPDAVIYAIDLGPMGQPTQSLETRVTEDGTHVTWRMRADMGRNPIARVMGLFMDRMMGKTFEQGLTNLSNAA